MKHVEQITEIEELQVSPERREAFRRWIDVEIEDSLAARSSQEAEWRESLKMYEGVPKNPARNIPIENAPNLEVTLGAIAVDAIYAQALDLIFSLNPPITTRATKSGVPVEMAKALQKFIVWGVTREWNLRQAAEHTLLDDIQLGTGIYYVPFVEHKKKTKVNRVTSRGPYIKAVPVEDFLVPGGAMGDLQLEKWIGHRLWLSRTDLEEQAAEEGWDIEGVAKAGSYGWVRSQRELLGKTHTPDHTSEIYEIIRVYPFYDIDEDGFAEDLMAVWDRTSRKLLKVAYNPYDYRPYEAARYQIRSHLFYGLGVMSMVKTFEEEVTEIHNDRILNGRLANSRFWAAREGAVPETMKIWPGKVVTLPNPKEDLVGVAMADVYPSSQLAEAATIALAERRVGVNDLNRPTLNTSSRTPGITALTFLQQANKRFAPAFDGIRLATAGAVRQCLFRYQERLLAGDEEVAAHIMKVLGDEDGRLVVDLLRDPEFDEAVEVETVASSASINREADKQNAIMLINVLGQYYQKVLELVAIASNPQTPDPVREAARKIANAAGELVDRTIRTFDQMRDPEAFIVNINDQLDQIEATRAQGLQGISELMATLAGGLGMNGGAQPPLELPQ